MNYSSLNKSDVNSFNEIKTQLTEEQVKYINSLSNLEISELMTECKNLNLKPKESNRQSIIQTIINSIQIRHKEDPNQLNKYKKSNEDEELGVLNNQSSKSDDSTKADINYTSPEVETVDIKNAMKSILTKDEYSVFIKQYINPYAGDYPEKNIDINRQFLLRKHIQQSEILNEYEEDILKYINPEQQKQQDSINKYSLNQQQKLVEEKPQHYINEQIQHLNNHSKFISENEKRYQIKGKISKLAKQDNSRFVLSQMLCIENEYNNLYIDQANRFLKNSLNSKLDNHQILNITKALSDPILFWNQASLLKFSSPLTISNFWNSLTQNVDYELLQIFGFILKVYLNFQKLIVYNLDNISMLVRSLYMIKKYTSFQTQQELKFFEKLTTDVLLLISEKNKKQSSTQLANILGYLKQINVNYTPTTQENIQKIAEIFVDIFKQEIESQQLKDIKNSTQPKQVLASENMDNSNPDFLLRTIYALCYIKNPPKILVDHVFKNLIDSGLQFYDKNAVYKILSQLMLINIHISDEIAFTIKKNRKVYLSLNLKEIYVFLFSFKDSNQDMGKFYFHFYFSFRLFLEDIIILNDFKQVLMTAKIQHHIITNKINLHKRIHIDKLTTQVLNLISKSCADFVCRDHIEDIIYISSLYIPYLNKPDYLFPQIIKEFQFLKFNSENRVLITNFITILLDKLKPHYEFFIQSQAQDLECNDKYTSDIRTLISLMVKGLIESKLLSYFLLTVQICAVPNLLKETFQNDSERKELAQNITLQIIKILGVENNKFGFKNLEILSSFIDNNFEYIEDKAIIMKAQNAIYRQILKQNQKLNDNENLLWIYYHSNILNKIQGDIINDSKQLLKEYFLQKVINPMCENQIVSQIIHENGIVQNFNYNVNYSNLQNAAYLPQILKILEIDINQSESIKQCLIPKILKESKYWNSEQLVNNLLNLHEQKINCFEIFENVCQNLFTTMIYYQENQEFQLNNQIYTSKDKLISLINAYAEQYYQQQLINYIQLQIYFYFQLNKKTYCLKSTV